MKLFLVSFAVLFVAASAGIVFPPDAEFPDGKQLAIFLALGTTFLSTDPGRKKKHSLLDNLHTWDQEGKIMASYMKKQDKA